RRWRGGVDEWPAAVDEIVAKESRPGDECTGRSERLAAGMERNDVVAALESGSQPPAVRPPDAGGMGLVNDNECLVAIGKRNQALHGRTVAIHAVEAFDTDPDAPHAALGAPADDRILDSIDVVMCGELELGAASAGPLMH